MAIYFGFSDECGDYKPNMGKKFLSRHPYYIRSTLLINGEEWKRLRRDFLKLKSTYGLKKRREIKWSYLWSLRSFQINNEEVPKEKPFKYLEKKDYHELIDFVDASLALLDSLKYKKVIVTVTENKLNRSIEEKFMLGMHLLEHMQRIEMELSISEDNLGILFFDPVNKKKNEYFRELYNTLFVSGDYIKDYSHIKDSLNIEESHHSVGIQLADFISGSFSAFMKSNKNNNYDRGLNMFQNFIYPHLRKKDGENKVLGYGIREVPRNENLRLEIKKKLTSLAFKNFISIKI